MSQTRPTFREWNYLFWSNIKLQFESYESMYNYKVYKLILKKKPIFCPLLQRWSSISILPHRRPHGVNTTTYRKWDRACLVKKFFFWSTSCKEVNTPIVLLIWRYFVQNPLKNGGVWLGIVDLLANKMFNLQLMLYFLKIKMKFLFLQPTSF